MHQRFDNRLPIVERFSPSSRTTCSVVIPVYNEQDNIATLHVALCNLAEEETSVDWEFLFVEDGSTDDTWRYIDEAAREYPGLVKAVRFCKFPVQD